LGSGRYCPINFEAGLHPLELLISSVGATQKILNFILNKSRFFELHKNELNSRQVKVINRMFEEGPSGLKVE
jgi:hypothetical protein